MEIMIDIFAVALGIVGLIGCILPVIPGPPVSYIGMVILYVWGHDVRDDITSKVLIVWLIVTVIVTILDYIVPAWFTKKTGGSKAASRGAFVGMVIGIIFFPPIGMIIGAFLGALLADMFVEGKELRHSLKSAMGSFLGFLAGTGLKLIASGVMMYYIIAGIC
jgi:uncharacterized protein